MSDDAKFRKYRRMATTGTLPPDFNDWALADRSGRTVAHVAALKTSLPEPKKNRRITMFRVNPDKLCEFMENQLLGRNELARLCLLSPTTIGGIIHGRAPQPVTIRRLLSGLQLDTAQALASGLLENAD